MLLHSLFVEILLLFLFLNKFIISIFFIIPFDNQPPLHSSLTICINLYSSNISYNLTIYGPSIFINTFISLIKSFIFFLNTFFDICLDEIAQRFIKIYAKNTDMFNKVYAEKRSEEEKI